MKDSINLQKVLLTIQGQKVRCPIWRDYEAWVKRNDTPDEWYYSPRAGGVFRSHHIEDGDFFPRDEEIHIKVSRWVYDKNRIGEIGYLTSREVRKIERQERLRIEQRMDRLLRCFAALPAQVSFGLYTGGGGVHISQKELQIVCAATECRNDHERDWLMSSAIKRGLLEEGRAGGWAYQFLTPKGVQRLEELETKAVDSEQAFVAMWFDESVKEAYERGIEPAIRDAGYKPLRIDKQEHIGKIDDQIIAEIRRSRFVVCDFTCELIEYDGKQKAFPRGGVYYEAGFAQGLGIPVIWMCRTDHIEHVHFDIRQFNHITWDTSEDLREKLRNRIGAVIGDGPLNLD